MNTGTTHPSRVGVALAFTAVYLIWGSTYLAIRIVVKSMPAFTSAGIRFVIAGLLLMAFLRLRGNPLPNALQWRQSSISGLLLLLGGNGLVVWAEKSLSSGRAALLVALAPVWFATLEWLRPGGTKPSLKTVAGIALGLAGVLLLVSGREGARDSSFFGSLAVLVAGISWASGSLYNKYSQHSGSPFMNSAAQMITGGLALLLFGTILGEPFRTDWSAITPDSTFALLYLVVFGSWVGYSAYVWLLKATTPAKASTYAYVNPVIAVFLGWAILNETITRSMCFGALVILAGVITITLPNSLFAAIGRIRSREVTPAAAPSTGA